MKLTLLLLLSIVLGFSQTKWTVDASHSNVSFEISHMVISETEGEFDTFSGEVESDGTNFENAKISLSIDPASINTDHAKRDGHLKSADFFDVAKYPKMTFVSTSFKQVKGKKYKLVGDLTMHGVTKSIELKVKFNGTVKDPWGNTRAGFKASGELDRYDYDLKWSNTLETGGLVVGKEVTLSFNIELIQAK